MCNVLQSFKHQIDRKSLETIYFTFIRPKLEYASIIWDDCTEKDKHAIENVQLRAARIVTGAKKGTSHQLLHDELKWPSLSERCSYFKLVAMQKIVNKTAPSYLIEILPNTVNTKTRYPLRNSNNVMQFQTRTEKFRKSFFPACINQWNNLNESVKNINDLDNVKSALIPTFSPNLLFSY